MKLDCFKAYDIRGRVPDQLNEEIAERIGRACSAHLKPRQMIVGRDIRLSSPGLADALARGLCAGGCDVLDIGLCGTEEVYHAVAHHGADGGIMVTASHNPIDYNGMKLVREGARPISGDSGLHEIRRLAENADFPAVTTPGQRRPLAARQPYIEALLAWVADEPLAPLNIVVNPGNGCAGPVLDQLEPRLPFTLTRICHAPDGSFPNGIPNPLLPENRGQTRNAVLAHGADFGVAWDGDFDRCFLFDEQGRFIEGYYIVGLLSRLLLKKHPGEKVIHDPRLTWNTIDIVEQAGGQPVQSKTGHAFIKERMRLENALYGGEMSAHHYFRDFAYCDSGMIPWLLVAALLSRTQQPLSQLVAERMVRFPASGEINRRVADADRVIAQLTADYRDAARDIDTTDGISLDLGDWRFNLRKSNTEPVIRLNVETRGDAVLMAQRTTDILDKIDALS